MGYFMHKKFMDEAIKEAEISLSEGGYTEQFSNSSW